MRCAIARRARKATIKQVELARDSVGEPARHLAPYVSTDPSSAEAFAFEIEESDLVEGIHHPQTVVELQAIDNAHWVAKPDMLRAQVAMTIDNMAFAYKLCHQQARCRSGVTKIGMARR
jgi:hypothetical protein